MTPLEINKNIAELKGIKNYEMDCKIQGMPVFSGFPNWAENISDAWGLFEEMPLPMITKDSNYAYKFQSTSDWKSAEVPAFDGLTAPMAICLAWIAWKQDGSHKPETKE